jgi:hypothetical protein
VQETFNTIEKQNYNADHAFLPPQKNIKKNKFENLPVSAYRQQTF